MPSRGRIQGYLAGRSVVLALLLALATAFQAQRGDFPVPLLWFFGITGCSFAFTLVSALLLRLDRAPPLLAKLQPAWDVLYATVLVYLSGGAVSPFATIYPLAILGAAILLFRRGAFVVATASSLAYGLLVDLQYYGVLSPLNPFPLSEPEGRDLVVQLLFNLLAFYAVAALSGYLAEELRRTGERLQRAEAEVLDLEHLQDSILRSLTSGLVALDPTGRELFHNRAAEELLSRAGIALEGGAPVARAFDLTGGDRKEASFRGGEAVLGYAVSPLYGRDSRPAGSILIFQDVSRVKRLEAELRRADRLAAVGRLAAGLAHEIRNPLASLSGSVEVLRSGAAPGAEDAQLFDIVLRETSRLNRLVTNFLHYARPGAVRRSPFELGALVDEVGFFFLQGEGKGRLLLENRVPPGVGLKADRGQLEQLLLNLFRNSVEASPTAVRVTVEGRVEESAVQFSVRDDGPGMPPEVSQRVFEPFFSARDGGTGLGLATVHRIVENHGGTVALETSPGAGTIFRFRFPSGDGDAEPRPAQAGT